MYFFGDSAHVFHVAKSGADVNGGLAQQYPIALAADAKLTINSAITAATSGDTIIIWPGAYDENIDVDTANKRLVFVGTHRHKSKIAPATGHGLIPENETVLYNLTISAMEADTGIGIDIPINKSNIVIDNCNIEGSLGGIESSGTTEDMLVTNSHIEAEMTAITIGGKRCIFSNCSIYAKGGGTLNLPVYAIDGGTDCVFRGCNIWAWREEDTASGEISCFRGSAVLPNKTLFDGCNFYCKNKHAGNTGDVIGIQARYAGSQIVLANSNLTMENEGTGSTISLKQTAGKLLVSNTAYDEKITSGTIIEQSSGFSNALPRGRY
jgi:pectin methylesterase-like acyl-CoA thioesterase